MQVFDSSLQEAFENLVRFTGVVPNKMGRVLSGVLGDPEALEHGLYVCGWLKRGPTGIIGTNLYCAEETVSYY